MKLIQIQYDFGDILATQAGGAIGGAMTEGMGLLMQPLMNQQQQQNQQVLINQQEQANEKLSAYNYGQQYDMWLKTNYPAQVQQLEQAGLNPALLYAKGGPGGTTGTPTSGAGMGIAPGTNANQTAQTIQASQGMALQQQLQQAQIKEIESQANLNNTQAKKQGGIDTDVAAQQLDNMRQQFDNTKLDMTLKNIQNYVQQSTMQDAMEYIRAQAKEAINQVQITANQKQISNETINSAITTIQQQAISATIHNTLTKAQIDNTQADTIMKQQNVQKMLNDIAINWGQLDVNQKAQKANELAQTMSANNPSLMNVLGRELNTAIDNIYNAVGSTRKTMTPATGAKQ